MPPLLEELHSITQIFYLTHHRNHNQHRLAKWYKWFNLLRRHLQKLESELATNIEYMRLSAKSKRTTESREVVEKRAEFLADVLIGKCYLAFTQLVADNQYAALGLMLLGCLARVGRVVEPLREEREEQMEEKMSEEGVKGHDGQDMGEVVKREDAIGLEAMEVDSAAEEAEGDAARERKSKKKRSTAAVKGKRSGEDSTTTDRPKKKKKKKKNGDAFDDLFAGLV